MVKRRVGTNTKLPEVERPFLGLLKTTNKMNRSASFNIYQRMISKSEIKLAWPHLERSSPQYAGNRKQKKRIRNNIKIEVLSDSEYLGNHKPFQFVWNLITTIETSRKVYLKLWCDRHLIITATVRTANNSNMTTNENRVRRLIVRITSGSGLIGSIPWIYVHFSHASVCILCQLFSRFVTTVNRNSIKRDNKNEKQCFRTSPKLGITENNWVVLEKITTAYEYTGLYYYVYYP